MQPTEDKVSNVSRVASGVILGLGAASPLGGQTPRAREASNIALRSQGAVYKKCATPTRARQCRLGKAARDNGKEILEMRDKKQEQTTK